MAKNETGSGMTIGSPSLILIFILLCLVTFGMLSLSTAKGEWNLAERNAGAVTEYYRADSLGEEFYRMVAETVSAVRSQSSDPAVCSRLLKQELGEYYRPEEGTVVMKIDMERAQALFLELVPQFTGEETVIVSQWKVIQTEDYEIDNSMPVWNGGTT